MNSVKTKTKKSQFFRHMSVKDVAPGRVLRHEAALEQIKPHRPITLQKRYNYLCL